LYYYCYYCGSFYTLNAYEVIILYHTCCVSILLLETLEHYLRNRWCACRISVYCNIIHALFSSVSRPLCRYVGKARFIIFKSPQTNRTDRFAISGLKRNNWSMILRCFCCYYYYYYHSKYYIHWNCSFRPHSSQVHMLYTIHIDKL